MRSEDPQTPVGPQAVYDAVATAYSRQFSDELDAKPVDRALLTALVELSGAGRLADIGCGPGHVTRFLAQHHFDVIGIDLAPGMIAVARSQAPNLSFAVGSMLNLPAAEGSWAGAVALYSIIHLGPDERAIAFSEFARTIRAGGWLLIAFHVDSPDFAAGDINHMTEWFGQPVDLDGYFLSSGEVADALVTAGFTVTARIERQPIPRVEYPSRRCYLLAQRNE